MIYVISLIYLLYCMGEYINTHFINTLKYKIIYNTLLYII